MQLFFEPRSVVLIGTSRQTGPGAYNNLEMLLSYGYTGRIHLVHPKVPDIMSYKTCPRVADLPEIPERSFASFSETIQHSVYAGMIAPLALLGGLMFVTRRNLNKDKEK